MLPPDFFGFILPFNRYAKKSVTLFTGGIEPDYERRIELMVNLWNKEDSA